MPETFRHYLTYQHNVQRFFREHADKYSGVMIPLSIATAFPSGTYGFIRALCHRYKDKYYAIDPRDALFQHNWNRENVREPHRKMVAALGGPFEEYGLERALDPADFDDDATIVEVTNKCLDYQRLFRTRKEDEKKLNKYKKLLGLSTLGNLREPQFMIPPYFQFKSMSDEWYDISNRCTEAAVELESTIPIHPVVHFNDWENVGNWKTCHETFRKLRIPSFWYYPNEFKEHEASKSELITFRDSVKSASGRGLNPYMLFGGYFSIMMQKYGLGGFGNGIGYGEWRNSGYHKGGMATTRVYILKLHRFLDAPVAQHIIEQDEDYFGRDTDVVSECIDSGNDVASLSLIECLDHFLECRQLELDFAAANDLADAVAEITETLSHLDDIGEIEREKYGDSLERWAGALK